MIRFRIIACLVLGMLAISGQAFAQSETTGSASSDEGSGPVGSGNNQVVSRDAIGVRVVPNPEHYSPMQWYNNNIKIKGAPQSLIVDGYEAVRDGRTVYVSAAKVASVSRCDTNPAIVCTSNNQCPAGEPSQTRLPEWMVSTAWAASCVPSTTPEIYTNIYIISYNQDPEAATTDIFGQLLQFWKFNVEIKNCSNDPAYRCSDNSECHANCRGEAECVCQPTATCSQTADRACMLDGDCPQGEYCRNKKSTIIRDVKRLADLRDMKDRLEAYNRLRGRFPTLESGTYLTNRTVSTWPSWSQTFSAALGAPVPTDPVNKLGRCHADPTENEKYEAVTCWNDADKVFSGTANPLALPTGSRAYFYQYTPSNNSFKFCGLVESGYVQGKASGSAICQTGLVCQRNCTNKQCGSDGCGGSCGTCNTGLTCNAGGRCVSNINQNEE